jgi:hypothetical protein
MTDYRYLFENIFFYGLKNFHVGSGSLLPDYESRIRNTGKREGNILTKAISFSTLFLTASIPRQEKISQMSFDVVLTGSTSLSANTFKQKYILFIF